MIPKGLKITTGSHPENFPYNPFNPVLTDQVRREHLTWVVKTRPFHQKDGHLFTYVRVTVYDFWTTRNANA